ncbi:MAG: hypothetical protein KAX65_06085 [Caldilineaceae bacterium]|nr:hypothetical protein [Caldilineaceae bacterium]
MAAAAGQILQLNGYLFLQLAQAGPVTVLVKLGSVIIHSVRLVNDGDGVVLTLPVQKSSAAASLYINLDGAKAVVYTIDVEIASS